MPDQNLQGAVPRIRASACPSSTRRQSPIGKLQSTDKDCNFSLPPYMSNQPPIRHRMCFSLSTSRAMMWEGSALYGSNARIMHGTPVDTHLARLTSTHTMLSVSSGPATSFQPYLSFPGTPCHLSPSLLRAPSTSFYTQRRSSRFFRIPSFGAAL